MENNLHYCIYICSQTHRVASQIRAKTMGLVNTSAQPATMQKSTYASVRKELSATFVSSNVSTTKQVNYVAKVQGYYDVSRRGTSTADVC